MQESEMANELDRSKVNLQKAFDVITGFKEEANENKCNEYRDLLELWAKWWDGPGRDGYRNPIIPPISKTLNALNCMICIGVKEEGERCQVCGRKL